MGSRGPRRCDTMEVEGGGYLRLSLLCLEQGLLQVMHTLHHSLEWTLHYLSNGGFPT